MNVNFDWNKQKSYFTKDLAGDFVKTIVDLPEIKTWALSRVSRELIQAI